MHTDQHRHGRDLGSASNARRPAVGYGLSSLFSTEGTWKDQIVGVSYYYYFFMKESDETGCAYGF